MTELAYQGFALLELMGHRQRIGRVSEVEMYGGKLLRIDVIVPGSFSATPMAQTDTPDTHFVTEFYNAGSIYGLTPLEEEVARAMAARNYDTRPVRPTGWRPEQIGSSRPTNLESLDHDFGRKFWGRRLGRRRPAFLMNPRSHRSAHCPNFAGSDKLTFLVTKQYKSIAKVRKFLPQLVGTGRIVDV